MSNIYNTTQKAHKIKVFNKCYNITSVKINSKLVYCFLTVFDKINNICYVIQCHSIIILQIGGFYLWMKKDKKNLSY